MSNKESEVAITLQLVGAVGYDESYTTVFNEKFGQNKGYLRSLGYPRRSVLQMYQDNWNLQESNSNGRLNRRQLPRVEYT